VVAHANRWARVIETARADAKTLQPGRYLEVQRELLEAEPQIEIPRLLAHLGVEGSATVVETATRLLPPGQQYPRLRLAEAHAYCASAPARKLLASLRTTPTIDPKISENTAPAITLALAKSAQEDGQLHEAEKFVVTALHHRPHHPALWHRRAMVRLAAGDEEGAVVCLTHATAAVGAPNPTPPIVDAAIELLGMSHRPEGIRVAQIGRISRNERLRGAVARWMVNRGLDEDAAEVLARVEHTDWHCG